MAPDSAAPTSQPFRGRLSCGFGYARIQGGIYAVATEWRDSLDLFRVDRSSVALRIDRELGQEVIDGRLRVPVRRSAIRAQEDPGPKAAGVNLAANPFLAHADLLADLLGAEEPVWCAHW